jgi:hypothetical protein
MLLLLRNVQIYMMGRCIDNFIFFCSVCGVHPEDYDHKAPYAKPLVGPCLERGYQEHIQEDRCSNRPWHHGD